MLVDRYRGEPRLKAAEHIPSMAAADEVNIWMASQIMNATDRITNRLLRRVRAECADAQSYCDEVATNILSIRRDVQSAAARVVERTLRERECRIERVRQGMRLDLRVAAVFLLDLVDCPGVAHGANPFELGNEISLRRARVYASHIRRALRVYGLDDALITVRSRGYLISPSDAVRVRMIWGE